MSSDVSDFGREHGVIHEAVVTGRKIGAGHDFWSSLAHDTDLFKQALMVVNGEAKINPTNFWIDTDNEPGSDVDTHVTMHVLHGNLKWQPTLVQIIPRKERPGNENAANVCVMRVFEEKPFLIPKNWYGKRILFRGTIFHSSDLGGSAVRGLEITLSGRPIAFLTRYEGVTTRDYEAIIT